MEVGTEKQVQVDHMRQPLYQGTVKLEETSSNFPTFFSTNTSSSHDLHGNHDEIVDSMENHKLTSDSSASETEVIHELINPRIKEPERKSSTSSMLSSQPRFTRKASSSFSDIGDYDDCSFADATSSSGGVTPKTPIFNPIQEGKPSPPSPLPDGFSLGEGGGGGEKEQQQDKDLNENNEEITMMSPEFISVGIHALEGEVIRVAAQNAVYIVFYKDKDEESTTSDQANSSTFSPSGSISTSTWGDPMDPLDSEQDPLSINLVKPPKSVTSLGAAGHKIQTSNCFTREYTASTRSLGRGLFRASTSVGSAFLKGAAGLVNQTYEGTTTGGVFGFAKGFGMGMLGLGTHAVKGAFRGVGQVTNVVGEMVSGAQPHFGLDGVVVLTNYRLVWTSQNSRDSLEIPIASIQNCETAATAPHVLNIECKSLMRPSFAFDDEDTCYSVLSSLWELYSNQHYLFAHIHCQALKSKTSHDRFASAVTVMTTSDEIYTPLDDYTRLKLLESEGDFKFYDNSSYTIFPSYPAGFIIPSTLSEEDLQELSQYRSASRIPVIVWRHPHSRAVMCRCAQPCAGLSGFVVEADQKYIASIQKVNTIGSVFTSTTIDGTTFEGTKFHFFDARSQMAAAANSAQGKGTEDPRNYPNTELHFCDIANIHAVRSSYTSLSVVCRPCQNRLSPSWQFTLRSSFWFMHLSRILLSTQEICKTLCEGESVMVHCSDGWDRTPQLTTLIQLLMDPFYRTFEGFLQLIEKEWCSFGHLFRWRYAYGECPGQQEIEEQSPVFVQWLDAVWQVWRQQRWAFEFNEDLLIGLYEHVFSGQYGNFSYNNERERKEKEKQAQTPSLWGYFSQTKDKYTNSDYDNMKNVHSVGVMLPFAGQEDDLVLWEAHYASADPICRKYEN